jgi:hypothetical protein
LCAATAAAEGTQQHNPDAAPCYSTHYDDNLSAMTCACSISLLLQKRGEIVQKASSKTAELDTNRELR